MINSNSHLATNNKGGTGKTAVAEFVVEGVIAAGQTPALVEVESVEARLSRLAEAGRVREHVFQRLLSDSDLLDDPAAALEFWSGPAAYMIDNAPAVMDCGAQAFSSLEFFLSITVRNSPWGRPDGNHGAGLTVWVVTDKSADGERGALAAASGLRGYLPGAAIVVVGNRGAGDVARRVAGRVERSEHVEISDAPFPEIYHQLSRRLGLYGMVSALSKGEDEIVGIGKELGLNPAKTLFAARKIGAWVGETLSVIQPYVSAQTSTDLKAAE